jgi:sigma-B regulation protein RsbU (phosphoserine phosphatase)
LLHVSQSDPSPSKRQNTPLRSGRARDQGERRPRPRGFFAGLKKFNTKFMLVTVTSVLLGALLNVVVARQGIHRLSQKSNREIEANLDEANREYLTNHIADKVQHAHYVLSHAYSDLQIFAGLAQDMVDHGDELADLNERAASLPLLQRKLHYNEKSNWYQNGPGDRTVITVWGYLGDHGTIHPEVTRLINRTALMDLVMPSFKAHGADKLQVYYTGPWEQPVSRIAPYTDTGAFCDKFAPEANQKNWYDFFYPGLVESWQRWLKEADGLKGHPTQITVTAPYEDVLGGGLIMTVFHPLWTADRKGFAGSVGLDLTLTQVIASIKDVRLAQTGFAFLTQADGNVLAVNDPGARTLGLQADTSKGGGVDLLQRYLKDSKEPGVASLALPHDVGVDYHEMTIAGEPHIIVLQRLPAAAQVFKDTRISTEYWTLGFVVPRNEMYASLLAAQKALQQTQTSIVTNLILIAGASFLVLMVGVYWVSRRMTGALVALSSGATRMRQGDYGVRVAVSSEDEVGQLSAAFNEMANEIQAYTGNLEGLVQERTREIEAANMEISQLNAKLAQENLRLGAELNVARRLQLMVLPAERELREIPGLDIAGYMAPADEVGGDYYDVLRGSGLVKIGIGDVTGHGLESGVLMLMVQTAVRTLLASNEMDPCRFLNIVNKVIYQNIKRINSDKNLTLTLLDYADGTLRLTGQHEEMIIVRRDGTLLRVDTTALGLPIGVELDISEFIYNVEIKIDPGDVVALFTDGITEADNQVNRQYGIERLCDVIVKNHTRASDQIKDAIIGDLMSHIGGTKIYDDITVLVIKRL